MLGLPKSTEYGRRIPKQKFYDNQAVPPAAKRIFVEDIKIIRWQHKVSAATCNLAAGKSVAEIEVIEIELNRSSVDEKILRCIDLAIPYHLLFLLKCAEKYQAWIAVKEKSGEKYKISRYYHTDWLTESELPLRLEGLSLDDAYENFVRQVGGRAEFGEQGSELTLAEQVAMNERRRALEKKIGLLEAKIHREKQINRQFEMNAELKKIRRELENLTI